MSTLGDFFGAAYDETDGEATCLYCDRSSKGGGGQWTSPNTWVCDKHIANHEADRLTRQEEIDHINQRIDEYIRWNDMQE